MKTPNDAIARRWFEEVWNQRLAGTIRELLTAESFCHSESGTLRGFESFVELVHAPFLSAFPDLRVTIEDTVSEGDRVVVRWRFEGTHSGPGIGMEASQRKVSFRGMTWLRMENGKILEGVDCWNFSGLMEALQSGQAAPSIKLA